MEEKTTFWKAERILYFCDDQYTLICLAAASFKIVILNVPWSKALNP